MKYKKILIFLIVCIIILSCSLITFTILSKETENVSKDIILNEDLFEEQNIHEDIVKENINQENLIEEDNTVQVDNVEKDEEGQNNKLESQNIVSDTVKSQEISSEEESQVNKESQKNKEQIATDLAKNEWGDDESVYYTIDRISGDKYYICVRSKATTETLAEYEIDIDKETVEIK